MSWQPQRKAAAWRVGTKDMSQLIIWSVVQRNIVLLVILFLFPWSHLYYVLFKKYCMDLEGPLQKEVEGGEQVRDECPSLKGREGKLPRGGARRRWWVLETREGSLNSRVCQEFFHWQTQAMQKERLREHKHFFFFSLFSAHSWLIIISLSPLSRVFHLKIFWPLWRGCCRGWYRQIHPKFLAYLGSCYTLCQWIFPIWQTHAGLGSLIPLSLLGKVSWIISGLPCPETATTSDLKQSSLWDCNNGMSKPSGAWTQLCLGNGVARDTWKLSFIKRDKLW